jgi:AcrR family transcriptional regulator
MMQNYEELDSRAQRSLRLIRDAFITLTLEKGFESITVRDITTRAQINRATFYRHYRDKYDLAGQINDLLLLEVSLPAPPELLGSPIAQTVRLFEHFAQYQEVYRVMLSPQGIPGFADLVRNHVEQQLQVMLSFLGVNEAKTGVPQAALGRYLAAAQVGFVRWWLDEGMPLTPTEAAECLLALHGYGGRVHTAVWGNDGESLRGL